jgi:hypothetical protein
MEVAETIKLSAADRARAEDQRLAVPRLPRRAPGTLRALTGKTDIEPSALEKEHTGRFFLVNDAFNVFKSIVADLAVNGRWRVSLFGPSKWIESNAPVVWPTIDEMERIIRRVSMTDVFVPLNGLGRSYFLRLITRLRQLRVSPGSVTIMRRLPSYPTMKDLRTPLLEVYREMYLPFVSAQKFLASHGSRYSRLLDKLSKGVDVERIREYASRLALMESWKSVKLAFTTTHRQADELVRDAMQETEEHLADARAEEREALEQELELQRSATVVKVVKVEEEDEEGRVWTTTRRVRRARAPVVIAPADNFGGSGLPDENNSSGGSHKGDGPPRRDTSRRDRGRAANHEDAGVWAELDRQLGARQTRNAVHALPTFAYITGDHPYMGGDGSAHARLCRALAEAGVNVWDTEALTWARVYAGVSTVLQPPVGWYAAIAEATQRNTFDSPFGVLTYGGGPRMHNAPINIFTRDAEPQAAPEVSPGRFASEDGAFTVSWGVSQGAVSVAAWTLTAGRLVKVFTIPILLQPLTRRLIAEEVYPALPNETVDDLVVRRAVNDAMLDESGVDWRIQLANQHQGCHLRAVTTILAMHAQGLLIEEQARQRLHNNFEAERQRVAALEREPAPAPDVPREEMEPQAPGYLDQLAQVRQRFRNNFEAARAREEADVVVNDVQPARGEEEDTVRPPDPAYLDQLVGNAPPAAEIRRPITEAVARAALERALQGAVEEKEGDAGALCVVCQDEVAAGYICATCTMCAHALCYEQLQNNVERCPCGAPMTERWKRLRVRREAPPFQFCVELLDEVAREVSDVPVPIFNEEDFRAGATPDANYPAYGAGVVGAFFRALYRSMTAQELIGLLGIGMMPKGSAWRRGDAWQDADELERCLVGAILARDERRAGCYSWMLAAAPKPLHYRFVLGGAVATSYDVRGTPTVMGAVPAQMVAELAGETVVVPALVDTLTGVVFNHSAEQRSGRPQCYDVPVTHERGAAYYVEPYVAFALLRLVGSKPVVSPLPGLFGHNCSERGCRCARAIYVPLPGYTMSNRCSNTTVACLNFTPGWFGMHNVHEMYSPIRRMRYEVAGGEEANLAALALAGLVEGNLRLVKQYQGYALVEPTEGLKRNIWSEYIEPYSGARGGPFELVGAPTSAWYTLAKVAITIGPIFAMPLSLFLSSMGVQILLWAFAALFAANFVLYAFGYVEKGLLVVSADAARARVEFRVAGSTSNKVVGATTHYFSSANAPDAAWVVAQQAQPLRSILPDLTTAVGREDKGAKEEYVAGRLNGGYRVARWCAWGEAASKGASYDFDHVELPERVWTGRWHVCGGRVGWDYQVGIVPPGHKGTWRHASCKCNLCEMVASRFFVPKPAYQRASLGWTMFQWVWIQHTRRFTESVEYQQAIAAGPMTAKQYANHFADAGHRKRYNAIVDDGTTLPYHYAQLARMTEAGGNTAWATMFNKLQAFQKEGAKLRAIIMLMAARESRKASTSKLATAYSLAQGLWMYPMSKAFFAFIASQPFDYAPPGMQPLRVEQLVCAGLTSDQLVQRVAEATRAEHPVVMVMGDDLVIFRHGWVYYGDTSAHDLSVHPAIKQLERDRADAILPDTVEGAYAKQSQNVYAHITVPEVGVTLKARAMTYSGQVTTTYDNSGIVLALASAALLLGNQMAVGDGRLFSDSLSNVYLECGFSLKVTCARVQSYARPAEALSFDFLSLVAIPHAGREGFILAPAPFKTMFAYGFDTHHWKWNSHTRSVIGGRLSQFAWASTMPVFRAFHRGWASSCFATPKAVQHHEHQFSTAVFEPNQSTYAWFLMRYGLTEAAIAELERDIEYAFSKMRLVEGAEMPAVVLTDDRFTQALKVDLK